jgi:hypothetical protein
MEVMVEEGDMLLMDGSNPSLPVVSSIMDEPTAESC